MVKYIITSCCRSKIEMTDKRFDVCPVCGNKYYDKPRDEFILFSAQDKFLSNNRDIKILWNEAYPTIKKYTQIILCKKLNSSNCRYTKDDLDDLSSDIAVKLMCKFSDICDYQVSVSFGEVIKNLIIGEIYSDKRKFQDSIINIENKDYDNNDKCDNNHSYMDYISYKMSKSTDLFNKNIYEKINDIYEKLILSHSKDKMNSILSLIATYHFVSKNKDALDELFVVFGSDFKEKHENNLNIIRECLSE